MGGAGGAGCVSFRREKYVPKGGPDGRDGGHGGTVRLTVDPQVRTLLDCREQPVYRAGRGGAGSGNNRTGKDGEDLVIRIPPGTIVKDAESGEALVDLVTPGLSWDATKGGRGGRGNAPDDPSGAAARIPARPASNATWWLELKLCRRRGGWGCRTPASRRSCRGSRARVRASLRIRSTLEPNLASRARCREAARDRGSSGARRVRIGAGARGSNSCDTSNGHGSCDRGRRELAMPTDERALLLRELGSIGPICSWRGRFSARPDLLRSRRSRGDAGGRATRCMAGECPQRSRARWSGRALLVARDRRVGGGDGGDEADDGCGGGRGAT